MIDESIQESKITESEDPEFEKPLKERIRDYKADFDKIKKEFSKVVVGQDVILKKLVTALICKGNVLLEGVPGLAKTLMVKTLSNISDCQFNRIQFTPDLLPSDITGVVSYDEVRKFYVIKGPIFANFILADEINRASPKVQSAMLESMQEKQATIGKETYPLPKPFFVIATQNPIESFGVYNLPEAQVDRFLFKLMVNYPSKEDEEKVLDVNTTTRDFKEYKINPLISPERIMLWQKDVMNIHMSPHVKKYIVSIVDATRHPDDYDLKAGKYLEAGSSPRASIGLYIASKANALINGRTYVTPHDVKEIVYDVLRHRVMLNYESQSEGIKSEDLIDEMVKKIPIP